MPFCSQLTLRGIVVSVLIAQLGTTPDYPYKSGTLQATRTIQKAKGGEHTNAHYHDQRRHSDLLQGLGQGTAAAARVNDAVKDPVNGSGPLTVVVTWRVRQGYEQEFETWRREISAAALRFPGHMGIDVILPGTTRGEYVVIFRFDTYQHLRAWQESDIRSELLKKAEPFREREPSYGLESGLEYWFAPSGITPSPPRWKMAIVTVLGVWPVSMLVPWLLNPLIGNLSLTLQALIIAVGIVIVLTWVVMPLLVKILRRWLDGNF